MPQLSAVGISGLQAGEDVNQSNVARKNILNNRYAVSKLKEHLELGGRKFEGETVFIKEEIANLLAIDERTVDRYLHDYAEELSENGYRVIRGKALQSLKSSYVSDMSVANISPKTPVLGIFTFRTLLNLAMLVTESDVAKAIRSRMLDIVIDLIAEKAGGHTKYINQRVSDYLPAAFREESYRKEFSDALDQYLNMPNIKYAIYTNKIYQAVFRENAAEYREILKLSEKDKVRNTMYSEVLNLIASFEHGLANEMKQKSQELGRKLQPIELDLLISQAENNPYLKPSIEDARIKMASRDLGFRGVQHNKLAHYIDAIPESDFEAFLGERSKSLEKQLLDPEMLAVFKRLKDR